MKISKGLKQAYDLQDFAYDAALALKDSLVQKGKKGKMNISREDASAICSLVKAWESCQERIRIHRNKPMPGALRPDGARRSSRPKSQPLERDVPKRCITSELKE